MDSLAEAQAIVNRGPAMMAVVWTLLSISTLVIIARLFVKFRALRRLFLDDWWILLAWIFGFVHAVTTSIAVSDGLGRPQLYVMSQGRLVETFRMGFMTLTWGFLSPMAGRIAFCYFMIWVAGTDARVKRWPFYVAITVQLVVNLTQVIVAFAQCGKRVDLIWGVDHVEEHARHCWDPAVQSYYGYTSGTINTVTDIFLAVMPAIIIYHSQSSKKKIATLASFLCLSVIAMIASIVKTIESRRLSEEEDYTYNLIMYVIWISIELNVLIVVSSIPIIRPLLSRNGLALIRRTISDRRSRKLAPATATRDRLPDQSWHDAISMSKNRSKTMASSIASEEELVARDGYAVKEVSAGEGILRTVEVTTVISKAEDVALAHAALVGLVL